MELITRIELPEPPEKLEHHHPVMFLGSCFATNVGERFEKGKFTSNVNPFGVMYNPVSVARAISQLITDDPMPDEAFIEHEGMWHSFYHHSSFSCKSRQNCVDKIKVQQEEAGEFLKNAEWLFITFGTAWVFEHQNTGNIVSNCHKLPSKEFTRYRLNVDEIVDEYKELLVKLSVFNPSLKVVFTVSPVRHWKDGAHGNQLSKSVLLLAVEQLCEYFDRASYFPSYELVMDELRDYRFYANDMLHLSDQAVNYIWERFSNHWLSHKAMEIVRKVEEITRAIEHKPFNPDGQNYVEFIKNTLAKASNLENKFPHLDFYSEKQVLNSRIQS